MSDVHDTNGTTRVAVVIVYWRGLAEVRKCLDSLARQTWKDHHVIVVDNSPGHDCRDLGTDFPSLAILRPGGNTGFAGGNNYGFAHTDAELVATLNPDTEPDPGWLEALVRAAEFHPQTASFASLQMLGGHGNTVDGAGDSYHISGLFWRRGHGKALGDVDVGPQEVFSPCAAAALYRRSAVMEVGGFDQDFFCYGEDVDLGFRLRLAGHSCRLVPEAVVIHEGGTSSGGNRSDFAAYHGHRNMVWVFVKNMPGFLLWLLLPLHLMANVASVAVLVLRGQGRTVLKAKMDALRGLPAAWQKRRITRENCRVAVVDMWASLSKRW